MTRRRTASAFCTVSPSRRVDLQEYWEQRAALSPESIGQALFTEEALKFIRREIRRRQGLLIDQEDLAAAIHGMLSTEAREQIGPLKIRRRRKAQARSTPPVADTSPPEKPPTAGGKTGSQS